RPHGTGPAPRARETDRDDHAGHGPQPARVHRRDDPGAAHPRPRAPPAPRPRAGGGSRTPPERQQKDFRILDAFENAAVAKIVASDWVDYLELAKWNGRWGIVNVLWELKPRAP